jgi:hypothetical protein
MHITTPLGQTLGIFQKILEITENGLKQGCVGPFDRGRMLRPGRAVLAWFATLALFISTRRCLLPHLILLHFQRKLSLRFERFSKVLHAST